jgi:hypothetical protein
LAGSSVQVTPAALSRNVAMLERNLGVRLLHRTTRKLTLTEACDHFLQEIGRRAVDRPRQGREHARYHGGWEVEARILGRDGRQKQPAVMLVDDSITLTDGTREVKFYNTPKAHSSGMLVGHVPDARVVFTADLVSDTFPLNPVLASAVHELIQENKLSVESMRHGVAVRTRESR